MRRLLLFTFLLLLSLSLFAGERAVRGPETLLGDATLSPISDWRYGTVGAIASDGDEIVLFWIGCGSLYAQRLDRNGNAVTPLPQILVRGMVLPPYVSGKIAAVHAGGHYVVFYSWYDRFRFSLRALRLTRELEPVDERVLEAATSAISDAVVAGDEIVLGASREVFRLRHDLTLIERVKGFDVTDLLATPHGVLVVTNSEPAIGVRMLDGSASARLASVYEPSVAQSVWTGSEYVVAWADYRWLFLLSMDRQFRATPQVQIDKAVCDGCVFNLVAVSAGEALLTWQSAGVTRAARVRNGVVTDTTPFVLGPAPLTLFRTEAGRFLTVDRGMNVRVFDMPPAASPASLAPAATIRTAMDETLADVAVSPAEIAVARHRANGSNIVSILDREGRPLREVTIRDGVNVALAHDGQDFYAVIHNPSTTAFQKVAPGAPVTQLPFGVIAALEWSGDAFIILQSGYADFSGQMQHKTRVLSVNREGKAGLAPCPVWELPGTTSIATLIRAGDDLHIVAAGYETSLRRDCAVMPLVPINSPFAPYGLAAAHRDGVWARVRWAVPNAYTIAFPQSLSDPARERTLPPADFLGYFDVAPLGDGGWLVVYGSGLLRAAVYDGAGHLVGTATVGESSTGRVTLVPIATDRVLAVTQRHVWEAPYTGVNRVVTSVITTEPASRRRTARP
ncbi:MAG TPA: hypothetical protein VNI54_09450 [Thermoanaerobaculia bacterium]|nr:hypothetical protein [Thermoanaerobaculia bacterium]